MMGNIPKVLNFNQLFLKVTNSLVTTLNMILSVTYNLELCNIACTFFTIDIIFYQVKLLMFNNVQTVNLTFVSKIGDIQ